LLKFIIYLIIKQEHVNVVLRTEMWDLSSLVPWVCVAALLEPMLYYFLAVKITPNQSDNTLHQTFLVNIHVVEK